MKDHEFLPLAEDEMNEAANFYEERKEGLGTDFLVEVERTVGSILAFPESGVKVSDNLRRQIRRRFPFGLIYAIEIDKIVIVAVAHLRRQPGYWRGRY